MQKTKAKPKYGDIITSTGDLYKGQLFRVVRVYEHLAVVAKWPEGIGDRHVLQLDQMEVRARD